MDMELNPSPLTPSDFYSGSTEQTALGDESPASALAARAVWGPHCLPSGPQSSFLIAQRPQLNPTPHPLRTLPSSTSMSTAPGQAQAAPTPTQGPLPSSRPHLVPTSLDPVMYLLSSLSAKRAPARAVALVCACCLPFLPAHRASSVGELSESEEGSLLLLPLRWAAAQLGKESASG